MGVHLAEGRDGIERLVHTGQMRVWLCDRCKLFCGCTYAIVGVVRYAFCPNCDDVTKQLSSAYSEQGSKK